MHVDFDPQSLTLTLNGRGAIKPADALPELFSAEMVKAVNEPQAP